MSKKINIGAQYTKYCIAYYNIYGTSLGCLELTTFANIMKRNNP